MTLLATFVGVGKYDDPEVLDVPGAANGATAPWAFRTHYRNLDARPLLDEEAAEGRIRKGALGLIDLPAGLTRGEDLALYYAGSWTLEAMLSLSAEELYVGAEGSRPSQALVATRLTPRHQGSCCGVQSDHWRSILAVQKPRNINVTSRERSGLAR